MNAEEFFYTTKQMRAAQKRYFELRTSDDKDAKYEALREAKGLETAIDNEIARVEGILRQRAEKQQSNQ